jgi:hypothetical protein
MAEAVRHWLDALGRALGGGYETLESKHFIVLAQRAEGKAGRLLKCAERCRGAIRSVLGEVADFGERGKEIVLALRTRAEYYDYTCFYDPEGEHGGSAGIHIREGQPHVALWGRDMALLEQTLAHELTHVALCHLRMPQWLEEGLAQTVMRGVTGQAPLGVDEEAALRHRRYWAGHGLDAFWGGDGFSAPGDLQGLSYELAEILVRLLVEESRPRWFGRAREPQRRFLAFLRAASAEDGGEAAAREHLGCGLADLAARFLGPAKRRGPPGGTF